MKPKKNFTKVKIVNILTVAKMIRTTLSDPTKPSFVVSFFLDILSVNLQTKNDILSNSLL